MVVERWLNEPEHLRDRMAAVRQLESNSDGDGEDHGGGCRLDEGARAPVKVERKGSVAMLVYHIRIYALLSGLCVHVDAIIIVQLMSCAYSVVIPIHAL